MALTLKDRCKQKIAANAGTGNVTLSTSVRGFKTISSALSNGDTSYFCLESANGDWEVFSGTYTASGTTVSRDTVLASSNSGNKIDIGTSITFCYIVYPADKATYKDGSGRIVSGAAGIIFSDASVQTTAATSPDLSPYLTISSAASTYLTQSSATTLLAAKADLVGGLIPSAQLPSYVDDVVEAANLAAFPGTGETGKIYVAIDTGYTYRWSGSVYVRINEVDLSSYLTTATAASTYLPLVGGTLTGDLKFTDATYDIGKSGATRPRDGFFSRDITVGTTANINSITLGSVAQGFVGISVGTSTVNIQGPTTVWGSLSVGTGWGAFSASNGGGIVIGVTDSTGIVHQRAGTTAQTYRVYETYSSTTSFGTLQIKANAGAAYQIGSAIGSAGGTNRAIDFGHWNAAGTFTSALSIATDGVARFSNNVFFHSSANTGIVPQGNTRFLTQCNSTSVLYFDSTLGVFSGNGGEGWCGNLASCSRTAPTLIPRTNSTTTGIGGDPANGILSLIVNGVERLAVAATGSVTIPQSVNTSGSPTAFTITGAAHTTLTTAEVTDGYFNAARTVNFGATGGTVANQRTWRFTAPTFTASAATTLTTASTVSISGPPVASTNVTITNPYTLNVGSGNSYFAGNVVVAGGTTSTVGIGTGAEIIFTSNTYVSTSRSGNTYGTQHLGSTYQGSYFLREDTASSAFGWGASGSTAVDTPSLTLYRDAADTLHQRRSTNAQTFRLAETYTSTTSFGAFQIQANTGGAYQIGSAVGSAGGTTRSIDFGRWDSAGAWSSRLFIDNTNSRVGIGTNTPAANRWLDIVGNQATGNGVNVFVTNTATDLYSAASLCLRVGADLEGGNISAFPHNFANYGLTNGLNIRTAHVLDNIAFSTGGPLLGGTGTAARLYISYDGNIGINTQSPTAAFHVVGLAKTNLIASTELTEINFNLSSTKTFYAGNITTQRAFRIQAPVYSFVGASTITTASTLSISGPPVAGTNATITNAYAFNIESGNSYFGGNVRAVGSSAYAPSYGFGSDNSGFFRSSSSRIFLGLNGNVQYDFNSGNLCINNGSFGVAGGDVSSNSADVLWVRDGAGIWATRNASNAQAFRVYNTYTSTTSFEAGVIDWKTESNTLCIGTIKGSGGGSARQLKIVTDGIAAITVSTAQAVTMSGNTTSQGTLTSERYGGDAWFRMRRANGTVASPTQVVTNNTVGSMTSNAYHSGGAFHTTPGGAMYFVATEDATATAQGTEFRLFTTANGGTTNTRRLTIGQDGTYTIGDACNFAFNTSTGTKLGTATTQKIGFWNATPVVQQTTAVASATVVGASGTTLTDADTFDGYSLAQVVKALRNLGILA